MLRIYEASQPTTRDRDSRPPSIGLAMAGGGPVGAVYELGALRALEAALGGAKVDLVLSDMAPNMSGMSAVDQPRAMYLAELALAFARDWLKPGGDFLVKVFQGEGFDPFLADCRTSFDKVTIRKPAASRPRSREVYVLGRGFKAG